MTTTLDWTFPLPRTHTGVPLGNGRMGLLVWGSENRLYLTIGRADLWDHRGGMPWSPDQSFQNIRSLLEENNEQGIRELFRPAQDAPKGTPSRPTVLPFGRLKIVLKHSCTLTRATLLLGDGMVQVEYRRGTAIGAMQILLHPSRDIAVIRGDSDVIEISAVTSWDLMREKLAAVGHAAPVSLVRDHGARRNDERAAAAAVLSIADEGWFWNLPSDDGAWTAWKRSEGTILLATGRADSEESAQDAADTELGADADEVEEQTVGWWRRYWRAVSRVDLPNRNLQELHDFGLYLFAGLTNPSGVAATLQGPWIEDYDFPPWSSDYHFNINVQMCYSPAFRSGALAHLRPLFDLVWSWRDRLAENARLFAGIDDGYMLPHAVDDTAMCMGSFWTGTIDHACTAWVAQMMYDYADYSGDLEFLREIALPFMRGTFAVYHAMLEDDGARLRMPVSVSPEYRGASMNAWGADASFQLAALHRLCENLSAASNTLSDTPDSRWADVQSRLPKATLIGAEGSERIALWEGTDLEESHRHHSHLTALAPFATIDPADPEWRPIVERSLRHWVAQGMGMWSGWCMSWASQLHSRVGNGEGAELILELWQKVFTNEGRASMHDAVANGVTLMGAPPFVGESTNPDDSREGATGGTILKTAERMQMDGAMGGVAAVQEMLLHERRGTLHVFPAIPQSWGEASFERMRAPGGFVVSAWWKGPSEWRVEVESTRDAALRMVTPTDAFKLIRHSGVNRGSGVFSARLAAGEKITLTSE